MGSGALNILWAQAVNDADGTFKPADQLEQLYESKGITLIGRLLHAVELEKDRSILGLSSSICLVIQM